MAVSLSGTKTVSNTVAPQYTGAALTTLLAIAVENLTLAQLRQIEDACNRVASAGANSTATIGSILV